jgi:hypothetical protein
LSDPDASAFFVALGPVGIFGSRIEVEPEAVLGSVLESFGCGRPFVAELLAAIPSAFDNECSV